MNTIARISDVSVDGYNEQITDVVTYSEGIANAAKAFTLEHIKALREDAEYVLFNYTADYFPPLEDKQQVIIVCQSLTSALKLLKKGIAAILPDSIDRLELQRRLVAIGTGKEFTECQKVKERCELIIDLGDSEFKDVGEKWADIIETRLDPNTNNSTQVAIKMMALIEFYRRKFDLILVNQKQQTRQQRELLEMRDRLESAVTNESRKQISDNIKKQNLSDEEVAQKLIIELQRYLACEKPIVKRRIKTHIMRSFGLSKRDFELELAELEGTAIEEKPKLYSVQELYDLEQQFSWLLPRVLPSSGSVVLGGSAGVGKTSLAIDIAYAIINGQDCLSETPTRKGRVLLASSDQNHNFTTSMLFKRGITENFDLLQGWNDKYFKELEQSLEQGDYCFVIVDSLTSSRDAEIDRQL